MSFLKKAFNYELNQNARNFMTDKILKVKKSKDGEDVLVFEPVDYPAIVAANGSVDDWKLENLLKAGISPQSVGSPHTGYNSRLEGIDDVHLIENEVASFLEAEAPKSTETNE